MRRVLASLLMTAVLTGSALAQDHLISIDVRDATLNDVIALLAAQSGRNMVADGSVKPDRVTLHLNNVSFDDALSVLVHSHDLGVRREGNILIIGTNLVMNRRYGGAGDEMTTQTAVLSLKHAKAEDVAKSMVDALSPGTVVVPDKRTGSVIITGDSATVSRARSLAVALDAPRYGANGGSSARAFALRYLRPSDVVTQLKEILPDGSYVADDRQNAVVVTGNSEMQETAGAFLSSVDVPAPQVMFEVKVADLQPQNDQSNVGIEWGGLDLTGKVFPGGATYAFTKNAIAVNATLNAMVTKGHATILATPKLVTLNNKEADLLIGQTYPVVFYDAKIGGQQVQFVDIGVKLRLTPTIGVDGSVTAEMHPEYSAIQGFVGGYPILANRKVDSTLRVRDSETIVLGGLLRDIDSDTVQKVPGLGDIPVFGNLFKNRAHSRERDEVVFLITPHILRGNETTTH
ncbi:MAG: type II secretion system protein GspD [Candidatus Eremiobacteraeota bacterium]|nr:type II secretion system protein GspD [Candidatus Eremiobacteraeota bacterium]